MLNTQRLSLLAWDNLGVRIIVFIASRDKHYYDEDDLEVGSRANCNVVVNHTTVLTEEEKAEARKQAIQQYQAQELRKLQEPKRVKAKASTDSEQLPQPSLFDM